MSVGKAVIDCPICETRLRFPSGAAKLRLTCPNCKRDCIVQQTESSYEVVDNVGLPALVSMVVTGKSNEAIKSAQDKVFPDQDGETRVHVSRTSKYYAKLGRTGLLSVAGAFLLLVIISYAALDRRSPKEVLDTQKDTLQRSWKNAGIVETPSKPILQVQLSDHNRVFFPFDSFDLKLSAKYKLNELLNILSPRNKVLVFGYADSIGETSYNLLLSARRAESVRNYLLGMNDDLDIKTKGLGEDDPIASNDNASDRSLNRRVDIEITAREVDTGLLALIQRITHTVQESVIVFWITLVSSLITIFSFPFLLFPVSEKILVMFLIRKGKKNEEATNTSTKPKS